MERYVQAREHLEVTLARHPDELKTGQLLGFRDRELETLVLDSRFVMSARRKAALVYLRRLTAVLPTDGGLLDRYIHDQLERLEDGSEAAQAALVQTLERELPWMREHVGLRGTPPRQTAGSASGAGAVAPHMEDQNGDF